MNLHDRAPRAPEVTTGPLPGSCKIYSAPEGHDDLRVPFREIAVGKESGEPPFHVYDTSGPYTDPAVVIDMMRGLPPLRGPWIEARGGVETYEIGRAHV